MLRSTTIRTSLLLLLLVVVVVITASAAAGFSSSNNSLFQIRQRRRRPSRLTAFLLLKNELDDQQQEQEQQNDESNNADEKDKPRRKPRKKLFVQQQQEEQDDYERRRALWLERYGSKESLQKTFGTSRRRRWQGDLNPEQTRRLYHTLLPRSLLGLYEMGVMKPDELAPLAYKARIAAKEYARSRCIWTGRLITAAFDQYRSLRYHGKLNKSSVMSWESIWQKYEAQIVAEEEERGEKEKEQEEGTKKKKQKDHVNEENSLTMRIYRRILERSVETNQAFDSLFLKGNNDNDEDELNNHLKEIATQLERDVRELLLHPKESAKIMKQEEKERKKLQKIQEKEEKKQRKLEEKRQKELQKAEKKSVKN